MASQHGARVDRVETSAPQVDMAQEGVIIPRDTSPDIKLIPATALDVERLSGSLTAMTCSDTSSSGPVPVLSADAVNNITIVPMTKLDSVSWVGLRLLGRPRVAPVSQLPALVSSTSSHAPAQAWIGILAPRGQHQPTRTHVRLIYFAGVSGCGSSCRCRKAADQLWQPTATAPVGGPAQPQEAAVHTGPTRVHRGGYQGLAQPVWCC